MKEAANFFSEPQPAVMPVDRDNWFRQLGGSNFHNALHEYDDISTLSGVSKILVIGPGQGLGVEILRWKGYCVKTLDIDEKFKPDYQGSVHDLSVFGSKEFDVILASHVLEHLPVKYLDKCIAEMARVSRHALIYLPLAGRHFQIRLKADVKGFDRSIYFDAYNYFHRPDGVVARYCAGQHYWEVGYRGYRVKDLKARFSVYYEVLNDYRNSDWNPSYNFVLAAR